MSIEVVTEDVQIDGLDGKAFKWVPVEQLVPYENNPRRIPESAVEALIAALKAQCEC